MAKNHRQNSNFQIVNFIAGACHTPDGAYAALLDLKEEREMAIENYQVNLIRQQAKLQNIFRIQQDSTEFNKQAIQFECQADLLEMNQASRRGEVLFEAAKFELEFINSCIAAIQPHRKYKNYPDLIANELAEREEWKFEFITRAQNFFLSGNNIPPNEIAAIRLHPDFETQINPLITSMAKEGSDTHLTKFSTFNFQQVIMLSEQTTKESV